MDEWSKVSYNENFTGCTISLCLHIIPPFYTRICKSTAQKVIYFHDLYKIDNCSEVLIIRC